MNVQCIIQQILLIHNLSFWELVFYNCEDLLLGVFPLVASQHFVQLAYIIVTFKEKVGRRKGEKGRGGEGRKGKEEEGRREGGGRGIPTVTL